MSNTEPKTMETILKELNAKVDAYNLSTDTSERVKLTAEAKELANNYNELSLLTTYAKCMEAELPIKALVETYVYNTVSTKDTPHKEPQSDGSMLNVITRSVVSKERMLNLVKFLEWAAEANKQVAYAKDWRTKIGNASRTIKTQWKKYLASEGDCHSVSNNQMKKSLQEMFDSLIFIPTEKGENSVIASGKIAKHAFAFANKLNPSVDKDASDGAILPPSNWATIQMQILRSALTGREFIVEFNDEAEIPANTEDTSETPATTEEATKTEEATTSETPATEETTAK